MSAFLQSLVVDDEAALFDPPLTLVSRAAIATEEFAHTAEMR